MYFTCHFCPRRRSGLQRYYEKRGAVSSGCGSGADAVFIAGSTSASQPIFRASLTTIFCNGRASYCSRAVSGRMARRKESLISATAGSTVGRSRPAIGRCANPNL